MRHVLRHFYGASAGLACIFHKRHEKFRLSPGISHRPAPRFGKGVKCPGYVTPRFQRGRRRQPAEAPPFTLAGPATSRLGSEFRLQPVPLWRGWGLQTGRLSSSHRRDFVTGPAALVARDVRRLETHATICAKCHRCSSAGNPRSFPSVSVSWWSFPSLSSVKALPIE